MTTISFMGANLVAQQLNWSMTEGWMQGDAATNAYYEPIETFPARFGSFVDLVSESGFDTLDVWTAQLNWSWATPAHLEAAKAELARAGMKVTSYAGSFGENLDEFSAACNVAAELEAPILGGSTTVLDSDRTGMINILKSSGRLLAIENHAESDPQEIVDKIGMDGDGYIGTAVDTGWWGTQGFDAAEAIRSLGGHVMHIHMKDILARNAHETCALGAGVVPIADCVSALTEIGFTGPLSIEHEPENYDPTREVILGKSWLLDLLDNVVPPKSTPTPG